MKRFIPSLIITLMLCGALWAQNSERDRAAIQDLISRAEKGEPRSIYFLGQLYEEGFDTIAPDTVMGMALYRKAAMAGFPMAMNYLGFRYYSGTGLPRDIDSAFYWIRRAADAGDYTAAANLGFLLTRTDDLPPDYEEAAMWLEKAAEAEVPRALTELAEFKRFGKGSQPDTLLAISYYEKAAKAGDPEAQYRLLEMMEEKWKSISPDSALFLGFKYYNGKLPVAGVKLLLQASEARIPQALALVGDAYSRGVGVPYEHEKSLQYFHEAALEGDASAQFLLAEILDFFPDTFTDFTADYWHEQAALKGVEDAQRAYHLLFTPPPPPYLNKDK